MKSENIVIAGRFIAGLSIISAMELVVMFISHGSPLIPLSGMFLNPFLAIFFLPPIVTSIYFMFSSKMFWRLDIILLLISICCIIGAGMLPFNS